MAGLYIHVPFCVNRCIYCDFYSQTNIQKKRLWIDALVKEMELRRDWLDGETIETIYFGGGTPSLLSVDELKEIFDTINKFFSLSESMEVTLEGNPDDMQEEYVKSLRFLPFNRISLGVQSFNDKDLSFLKRRHNSEQAIGTIKRCQDNGLENISIDLIYGLPGQTLSLWDVNLDKALQLELPHISAYHLIYEENTKLYDLYEKGAVQMIDEEVSLSLLHQMINRLEDADYEHYEISNFAHSGAYSKHNSSYWKGEKYLGLGPSAHSYNGDLRQWNTGGLTDYVRGILSDEPAVESELLDVRTKYNDYVITRLRTMWGVQYKDVQESFGDSYLCYLQKQAKPFISQKMLIEKQDSFTLSREGIFLSDAIMRELLFV